MRRLLLGVVAAFAAVLLLPTAAWADAVVTFESPSPDELVSAPIEVSLRIERRLIDPHPQAVTLRLSADGTEPHPRSATVDLDCVENCEGQASETVSRWAGVTLHPGTLAPFDDVRSCNGRWWLLPAVEPGPTARADGAQGGFLVSQPAAAAAVDASVDGDVVELRWSQAREGDVVAYRVERRRSGATTWDRLAEQDADIRRYRDEPGTGRFEYRVVTLRPDGRVDGEPAPACRDRGRDLATPSAIRTVSFTAAGGSVAPIDDPSGSTGSGEGGEDDPTVGDDATEGTDTGDGAVSAAGRSGSSPRDRLASAGGGSSVAAPQLPTAAQRGGSERFFGQDGPFSEQLDYADVDALANGEEAYGAERVSGGVVEIFDRELDLEHALRPVATGMVLVGFGLHLRRWVRASD